MQRVYHKKKYIKRYAALTHTFTYRIGDKANQNKENRITQSKRKDKKINPTSLPIEVLIKNQNNTTVDYVIRRKN